jgi:hypothetical protein
VTRNRKPETKHTRLSRGYLRTIPGYLLEGCRRRRPVPSCHITLNESKPTLSLLAECCRGLAGVLVPSLELFVPSLEFVELGTEARDMCPFGLLGGDKLEHWCVICKRRV